MSRLPSTAHPLARPPVSRRAPDADALEWEELPSLADVLQRYRERGTAAQAAALAWTHTQPQALDDSRPARVDPAVPFDEVIDGLHTRELVGPDLFEHFFGVPQPR
ncbi:MAG: hypothetical protein L6Q73_18765 [Aquabacterium sp.]|jgi:hypothetical protein|nr:hypothetical protein [Aquabacterium sp.]